MAIADIGNFTKVTFVNDTTPAINATNLNALESRMQDIDDALSQVIGVTATDVTLKTGSLYIDDPSSPTLYLREGGSTTNFSQITDFGDGDLYIIANAAAGDACQIYMHPLPADGTSAASIQLFRVTNTTGSVGMFVYKGNNSATVNAMIAGSGNTYVCADNGNFGVKTTTFGTSGVGVLGIGNGTEPSTSPANMIQLYSKDSSAGAANATLALRTEQAVEDVGTFTPTKKIRVWINGVEYHIQLDPV